MSDQIMEAATTVARESPEAAGILASIIDSNSQWREAMLPTWEDLKKAEERAFEEGYARGMLHERQRVMNRIFGWGDDDGDLS